MWMISKLFQNFVSPLLAILFPTFCFICKRENTEVTICKECLSRVQKPVDTPAPYIISTFSYKNSHIKKAIHAIKYFHRKDLITPFAKALVDEVQKIENYKSYTLIPVPMPLFRKYTRGYNHTEALASLMCEELTLPYRDDILISNKKSNNKRQVTMHSRSERLDNKRNTFIVSKNVQNMNILLIDDVTTTGATLSEARRVLLKAGASRVMACTIAH